MVGFLEAAYARASGCSELHCAQTVLVGWTGFRDATQSPQCGASDTALPRAQLQSVEHLAQGVGAHDPRVLQLELV